MNINFPRAEEEILKFWNDIDAFQTQLRLTEGKDRFTFYDGPPFGALLSLVFSPFNALMLWYLSI